MKDFRKIERELIEAFEAQGFETSCLDGEHFVSVSTVGCPLILAGACAHPKADTKDMFSISVLAERLGSLL